MGTLPVRNEWSACFAGRLLQPQLSAPSRVPMPVTAPTRHGALFETPPFEPSSARGGVLRFEAGHRTALGTLPSQYSRCPAGLTTAVACRVRSSLHAFERHRQLTLRSLANAKERPVRN